MTNREFISQVRSLGKMVNSDILLNDRSIVFEGNTSAAVLIKKETNLRKLWQSPNLFTRIPCLEMEEVPLAECCEYTSDETIARSKQKLPKIAEGIFGLLIQQVSSIDNKLKFAQTTPMRYSNLLKLGVKNQKTIYFWMYDDYLYVSNPSTEAVSIYAYFDEIVPNSLLFPTDCNCTNPPSLEDRCKSNLDKEFKCPSYLIEGVKGMVYEKIMNFYEKRAKDVTSDNLDESTR